VINGDLAQGTADVAPRGDRVRKGLGESVSREKTMVCDGRDWIVTIKREKGGVR